MNYDDASPHSRTMSMRQIEVFRAIMMTGSISEAARSLYVAQPSVSRVLQVTERRLGFLLFERTRGRLYPTPEAKRIFEEVMRAYEGIERVDDLVRALSDGSSGTLNVVCSPSLGVHLVPLAIARFHAEFRKLPVSFEPLTHNHLVPRVLFGKGTIGVSMFEVQHPNIVTVPMESGQVLCVARKGTLGKRRALEPKQIAALPWIDYEHDTPLGRIVGTVFSDERRPEPVVRVRSAISACTLAREGVGVAIVDPFCIDDAMRDALDVVPLRAEGSHRLTASLVYSHVEPLSNAARRFVEILDAVLKQHLAPRRAPKPG
ncbi:MULTISPECIES: LysR substrate-binding domain-containing protein [unclassified Caballeronia]|uniref:LysR substrate-binding domain-containing protein n=1 Tax=unclassified Caballeronia TaxID=2646786 RepID=UPI00286627F5|nr:MULTISPECIES: LysR substrate-binding domain-containing protein [unclassified Caballeronia]MDR5822727.1 LysR substrate-binding domain-containing protein [Caballeronia sp. LZ043]MDR5880780.1 LysR substrate-binding domain-containing protein [Caballeronia sp. LZ032]